VTVTTEPGAGFSLPADLGEMSSVRHWVEAQARHWNRAQGEAELKRKLDTLRAFCETNQVDPDTLVQSLFRPTPEGPRIRLKQRRLVVEQIAAFEAAARETQDVRAARDAGNVVRSFLIHNGVAMTAPIIR
jgi:lambda repressor-like predicted transcriptional regulator